MEIKLIPKKRIESNYISLSENLEKNSIELGVSKEYLKKNRKKLKHVVNNFFKPMIEDISKKEDRFNVLLFFNRNLAQGPEIIDYLYGFDKQKRDEFFKKIKKLDVYKKALVFESIRYNAIFNSKANIFLEIERIKKGLLTPRKFANGLSSACSRTYKGFLKALEKNTLGYVRIKVNGKNKLLFTKSASNLSKAQNLLGIDPNTMKVYSINFDKKGNAIYADYIDYFNNFDTFKNSKDSKQKKNLLTFQERLDNYIKKAYSEKNLSELKNNMKKVISEYKKEKANNIKKPIKKNKKKKLFTFFKRK